MKTKFYAVMLIAAIVIGATSTQTAFGQSLQITEGVELSTEQVVFVVIIGSIAGLVKSWQGYDKSPNNFDLLRFANGVRDNILISIPVALGTALTMPDMHAVGYVMLFFTVMGAAAFVQSARKKSIPSNASEEEIERILEERP